MRFRTLTIALSLILLSACGNRRLVTSEEGILLELPDNAYSKVSKNMPEFEYLSLKAKSAIVANGSTQNFTLTLKMRKDSFIWASISGFGFEAVRALITVDSVTVLDRLGKKYYKESIGYLNNLLGLEISMAQLQDILVGKPPLGSKTYQKTSHDLYHEHLRAVDGMLQSILLINSDFLVSRSRIEKLTTKDVLDIRYMNFKKIKGVGDIPENTQIKVSDVEKEVVEINLNYTNINTDKFDNLPISIPQNYEKGS